MEQIDLPLDHSVDLPADEEKNVYLAVAVGCLNTIHNAIPGPPHRKQKRIVRQLADDLLKYIGPRIPKIKPENKKLFNDTITASGKVLDEILEETGQAGLHVMLNLAGFCLDELPTKKNLTDRYNSLFKFWDARQYKDAKSGQRVFERINAEVHILVAERGGIII